MGSDNNSTGASKILLAFFGGVAAGIAAGYYLNSDQGRKLRTEAADKVIDLEARIEAKVKEAFEATKEKVNNIAGKAHA
jgi:hypothetical protein